MRPKASWKECAERAFEYEDGIPNYTPPDVSEDDLGVTTKAFTQTPFMAQPLETKDELTDMKDSLG